MALAHEIIRATGGPTVMEGLSTWYGRTSTESLNDAEYRWLDAQIGVDSTNLNDMWFQYLGSLGHTGALNDRKLKYWAAQP